MFCHLAYSDVMVNGILQPDGVGRCIGELHNLVTPGKVPEGVASLDRIPRRIMVDSYPHEDEAPQLPRLKYGQKLPREKLKHVGQIRRDLPSVDAQKYFTKVNARVSISVISLFINLTAFWDQALEQEAKFDEQQRNLVFLPFAQPNLNSRTCNNKHVWDEDKLNNSESKKSMDAKIPTMQTAQGDR